MKKIYYDFFKRKIYFIWFLKNEDFILKRKVKYILIVNKNSKQINVNELSFYYKKISNYISITQIDTPFNNFLYHNYILKFTVVLKVTIK